MGLLRFWAGVTDAAGWRFATYLIMIYACTKGGGATLVELGLLPLFQRIIGVSSASYQSYKVLVLLPFSMKPAIALVVDSFDCKRGCVAWTVATSVVCTLALAVYAGPQLPPFTAACLGFGAILGVATADLVTESQYAILMRSFPALGSSFVTLVWATIFLSRLLMAALSSTILTDERDFRVIFGLASVLFAVGLVPTVAGWLRLQTLPDNASPPSVDLTYLSLMLLAAAVCVCTVSLGDNDPAVTIVFLAVVAGTLLWAARETLSPIVRACNTYMFLSAAFYVDVSALDYFYTSKCIPGGPQFSYAYFLSTATVVSSIFGALASVLFQSCFQNRTFKQCFVIGTLAKCSGAIIDVVLVNRWNVGIVDDKVVFMLGNCGLRSCIAMLDALPMVILVSRLTPKGSETTMYALLAGFQNLGSAMSIAVGVCLAKLFAVNISKEECEYKNLSTLVMVAQMGMPLLALPFLRAIPNKTIKEAF